MNEPTDHSWIRPALDAICRLPRKRALEAIRSLDELERLRAEIVASVARDGASITIPGGDYGNNLLMALLALRVKFPREEAVAKLELNITMRARRSEGIART